MARSLEQLTSNEVAVIVDESLKRFCWICFGADEEDTPGAAWVSPCRCRGTTKWVHQNCIQRWVDEKQNGSWMSEVHCPQCNTAYTIEFPASGMIVSILDRLDNIVYRFCPFVTTGIVLSSLYCTAVVYGGLTVLQVMGYRNGLLVMEKADPIKLMIALPAIPLGLILAKLVQWEEYVTHFLRRRVAAFPILGYMLPAFRPCNRDICHANADLPELDDPVSITRIFCSALLLPSIANACGHLLFESLPSNTQRTMLGGIVFIALKGTLRVFQKQQHYIRQASRCILDYQEPATSDAPGTSGS